MAKRRPHPDTMLEAASIIHGGAQLFATLRRCMNKRLAAELLAMEAGQRDLTRRLSSDESFGALHRLAKEWSRKSPQFFGEQVLLAAREALEANR